MNIHISFDDAHISDLRAAKLLSKYGFRGTFYMPSCQVQGSQIMSLKEVKEGILDLGHEIGGHTVSHPMDIKLLNDADLKFEIENNKFLCEMLNKKLITKFCYPRGRHDERVREAVAKAGYTEARTTIVKKIRNHTGSPLTTPTTVQMFARNEYDGRPWFEVAKEYFYLALKESETDPSVFFHIWGHTYELDRQGDWDNWT